MRLPAIIFIGFLLLSGFSRADIVVLVHGYQTSANIWYKHNITRSLNQIFQNKHQFYAANLPSNAPISVQAAVLSKQLKHFKNQPIILVGHSVGGLVARFLTVKQPSNIKALITLASPHLGSELANGVRITNQLLDTFMPFTSALPLFNKLNNSQGLMQDISINSYLLNYLNQQTHPDICYVSILRNNLPVSEFIINQNSQNMNYVPALTGKSLVLPSHNFHALKPIDSAFIARAISQCLK